MSRERYEPAPVPMDLKALPEYIQRELRRIGSLLKRELEPAVYMAAILDDGSVVIPSGVGTDLPFTKVSLDTKNLFDAAESGVDISAGARGYYLLIGYVNWLPSITGDRRVYLTKNGGVMTAVSQPATGVGNDTFQNVVAMDNLDDGNTVRVQAFQDSGASLTVASAILMLARLHEVIA